MGSAPMPDPGLLMSAGAAMVGAATPICRHLSWRRYIRMVEKVAGNDPDKAAALMRAYPRLQFPSSLRASPPATEQGS